MKNNKLVMIMLIILVAIALVGTVAIVMILNHNDQDKHGEPMIDEVLKASVDIPEITTNLAETGFVRISFKIQTNNKKAKEELEKRNFQVNNIIILELSEQTADTLNGREGQTQLEDSLKNRINELMQDGKVEKVYITQFLLQ